LAKLPVAGKMQNSEFCGKFIIYNADGAVKKLEKRIFIERDVFFVNNGLWWWWP
jgi:hypothetical protein